MRKKTLIGRIEDLARAVADSALSGEVSFAERLDALKILTTYYVGMTKANKKSDDGEDRPGFDHFRRRIEAAANTEDEDE